MNTDKGPRFLPDIICDAVWPYYRFNLSHRDIEDLLAERGIIVTWESIRRWRIKFGTLYAGKLKRKHQGYGDTFYVDEIFVRINGKQHYLVEGSEPSKPYYVIVGLRPGRQRQGFGKRKITRVRSE